jgi:hypothetical protein
MQKYSMQSLWFLTLFTISACSSSGVSSRTAPASQSLSFGPAQMLGRPERNPSAPFLRYAPDGHRLFAIWSEDHDVFSAQGGGHSGVHHRMSGDRAPAPMRDALLAWSDDAGKAWSTPRRVNSALEAVQGEENGPKVAIGKDNKAYIVWSIPGEKGDKTRANIRFAMEDGNGGFTPATTLNEVKDAARFPILEGAPDGNLLVAWIDRRIDNPKPRQLYLMRIQHDGTALTKNYQAGQGLCECCKLGISFADAGKTVYIVDRQVDGNKIRNHVVRKSIDGGNIFAPPVQISDDGWQVPSCPHSGPSIGRDSRGYLHVTWFTLGRSEKEAGIYYSVSKDGGKTFAPRQLVQANTAPEILYNNLSVAEDNTVYLVWSNLDSNAKSQIYLRKLGADGRTWSPIQQISKAKGNASRPGLALMNDHLHIAWTETEGETSRAVFRTATVSR